MPYVTSWERRGIEKGLEEGKREGIQEGKREGIKVGRKKGKLEGKREGQLLDKQEVLTRQLSKKFGLEPEERELIAATKNSQKLNKALDAVIIAATKEEVLCVLG